MRKLNNYIAPQMQEFGFSPENIICESTQFGFKSEGGIIIGNPNAADYGYGAVDNGEY